MLRALLAEHGARPRAEGARPGARAGAAFAPQSDRGRARAVAGAGQRPPLRRPRLQAADAGRPAHLRFRLVSAAAGRSIWCRPTRARQPPARAPTSATGSRRAAIAWSKCLPAMSKSDIGKRRWSDRSSHRYDANWRSNADGCTCHRGCRGTSGRSSTIEQIRHRATARFRKIVHWLTAMFVDLAAGCSASSATICRKAALGHRPSRSHDSRPMRHCAARRAPGLAVRRSAAAAGTDAARPAASSSAAKLSHFTLYALLFAVPFLGIDRSAQARPRSADFRHLAICTSPWPADRRHRQNDARVARFNSGGRAS